MDQEPITGIQGLIDLEIAKKREDRDEAPRDAWRSSGLGFCLVTRYLERTGVPADEDFDARTLRVFSVGELMEDWLVDLIKRQPGIICETQKELYDEELNLRGHFDIKLTWENGECKISDCKSKHSKSFWYMDKKGEGANKHHLMQVWSYLYMDKVERGSVVYLSKDDLSVLEYPVFLSDERIKRAVFNELIVLNEALKAGLPPPPIRWDFEKGEFVALTIKDWQYNYSRWQKQIFTQKEYLDISNLKLV